MESLKFLKFIFLVALLAVALLLNQCSEKNQIQFNFCKDLEKYSCIPPLENKKIIYRFPYRLDYFKTRQDLIHKIYFAGDTVSFELKHYDFKKEQSSENIKAYFHFGEAFHEEHHEMGRFDVRKNSISGFTNLGTILQTYYTQTLAEKPLKPSPFILHFAVYHTDVLIIQRSITVQILLED